MPPPKKKSHKRLWLILAAIDLVLVVIIGVAAQGPGQKPAPATQATQPAQPAHAARVPAKAPIPNLARLGGAVHDFDLKFGKEDTSNSGIGYQPFGSYTSGQDLPTDKISILVENGHVEGVIVTLPRESPLSWQDGTTFCQSFLPTDAVFKSVEDFSPSSQSYQQMYMSKEIAKMFSADHFMEGTGLGRTPVTLQQFKFFTTTVVSAIIQITRKSQVAI